MNNIQKEVFEKSEANNWFERNKEYLDKNYKKKEDYVVALAKQYNLKPKNVLDIGCSNGYRAALFAETFGANASGIDLSSTAIEKGKTMFPNVSLTKSSADDLSMFEDNQFDFVIINFVFSWLDRNVLFQVVKEINRVLQDQGILMIGDFYPSFPQKVRLHHVKDQEIFTYKQFYPNIFKSFNTYTEVITQSKDFGHAFTTDVDYSDKCFYSMLKKDLSNLYLTKDKP